MRLLLFVSALSLVIGACSGDSNSNDNSTADATQDSGGGGGLGNLDFGGSDTRPPTNWDETAAEAHCRPCAEGACPDGTLCINLPDGAFCLVDCEVGGACGEDNSCLVQSNGDSACVPDRGVCRDCPDELGDNACGGCGALEHEPGSPCGECGLGVWECSGYSEVACVGGDERNACGGCGSLSQTPGDNCGPCLDGAWVCDGSEALSCEGASPDSDGDGVCDPDDICPGHDDRIDTDGDGHPDGCDPCPNDRYNDSDNDGSCDSDDICPGHDDRIDTDGDGVPDGCDQCHGYDDSLDVNGNGIPDDCDCEFAACGEGSFCVPSNTGTQCNCLAGWEWSDTLGHCVDVDECATGTHNCSGVAVCVNAPGTFGCECPSGYEVDGTGCKDINECARRLDNCDSNATCNNTPGSFTCQCQHGYQGDGTVCSLVNTLALMGFGSAEDSYEGTGPGRHFSAPNDRLYGSRDLNISQISRVNAVSATLAANNVYEDAGAGCLGVISLDVRINGQSFGTISVLPSGAPSFQPRTSTVTVTGPTYDISIVALNVSCGNFEFATDSISITVRR